MAAGGAAAAAGVVAAVPADGAGAGAAAGVQDGGVVREVRRGEKVLDEGVGRGRRAGRDGDGVQGKG